MSRRSLKQLAQAAEEVGAVALQLLHLPREGDIQAPAEVVDLGLAVHLLGFRSLEHVVQRGNLLAQARELEVEEIDFGERFLRDRLLVLEALGEARELRRRSRRLLVARAGETGEAGLIVPERGKGCLQGRELVLDRACLALLERQELVSSEIWRVRRRSAVSLPGLSWRAKNCASRRSTSGR